MKEHTNVTAQPARVRKKVLIAPMGFNEWMELRRESPRAFYSASFLKLMREHRETLGYSGFYGQPQTDKGASDNA